MRQYVSKQRRARLGTVHILIMKTPAWEMHVLTMKNPALDVGVSTMKDPPWDRTLKNPTLGSMCIENEGSCLQQRRLNEDMLV